MIDLIKKGAEANLYLDDDWHGRRVVVKVRPRKKYRPNQLDLTIRQYRTIHEPQFIHDAKRAGVPTPLIFLVDVKNTTIVMEHIQGKQIKQVLDDITEQQRLELCSRIGELISRLHLKGIIHGDLTTSNMILAPDGKILFVDFGLGERSEELEARGVDLHLLKRALQSTHFKVAEECFRSVLEGYAKIAGSEVTLNIMEKIREIEKRGRYVAERRQDVGAAL